MKILKNTFIKSTLILILSGMATKVLGLIIKIIFTRIVSTETLGLYSLVMPTYSLLLTISTMAMPMSIAKLISEEKSPKILNTASIIILIINFLIIILMHFLSPFIANNLLKNPDSYYLLIACSYTLPFASLACILKGYFYGKQKMVPHVLSNVTEQIIRLLIIIIILPKLVKISYVHAAIGLILTSFFTELASVIVFLLCMDKKDIIVMKKIEFKKEDAHAILNISVPSVSSHILGNICYFLEPIILTNVLLYKGYSASFITLEYGIYNAYAISTLTIPSFFISAISMALVPELAKNLQKHNVYNVKKIFRLAIILGLIIGFSFTMIIFIFRNEILMFLYKSTLGSNYIKFLAPFFILFYLENIFASFMQASGNTKVTFKITLFSSIEKIIVLTVLSFFKIGIYSLVISEITNILMVVLLNYLFIKKYFKNII